MAGNKQAATRYAKALFSLARETDQLEKVRDEMAQVGQALVQSEPLRAFIGNLLITGARREATLAALFEERLSKTCYEFILLLERKKRLRLLPDCCSVFRELYNELTGVLKVTATSAHPLLEAQLAEITRRLSDKFSKTIQLETKVDAGLIGGFKLQSGDQIFDYSIATQLEQLKQRLIHA